MITRRTLLKAGVAAAGYALGAGPPVLAQAIRTDTQGLAAGEVAVKSGRDTIPAYEARPDRPGRYPVILVISEIWGVHEYIRDVARRFAKEDFYAIAPELFHREGGVGHLTNIQDILKIVFNVPRKQLLQDLSAAASYARAQAAARADRGGVTGFCWGGGTTVQFAAHDKTLGAAVCWYGPLGRRIGTSRGRSPASTSRRRSPVRFSACSVRTTRALRPRMSASSRPCSGGTTPRSRW